MKISRDSRHFACIGEDDCNVHTWYDMLTASFDQEDLTRVNLMSRKDSINFKDYVTGEETLVVRLT
jgi:hypothetical protein